MVPLPPDCVAGVPKQGVDQASQSVSQSVRHTASSGRCGVAALRRCGVAWFATNGAAIVRIAWSFSHPSATIPRVWLLSAHTRSVCHLVFPPVCNRRAPQMRCAGRFVFLADHGSTPDWNEVSPSEVDDKHPMVVDQRPGVPHSHAGRCSDGKVSPVHIRAPAYAHGNALCSLPSSLSLCLSLSHSSSRVAGRREHGTGQGQPPRVCVSAPCCPSASCERSRVDIGREASPAAPRDAGTAAGGRCAPRPVWFLRRPGLGGVYFFTAIKPLVELWSSQRTLHERVQIKGADQRERLSATASSCWVG